MSRARAVAAALIGLCASSAGAIDLDAHGYVDCRLVARAGERSWLDGGLGKTRFGGGGTYAGCLQAGATATAQLAPSLLAVADVQYQTSDHNDFSLLEAYLRWRPVSTTPLRASVRLGAFFPPVSLENDAIGWTSPWTLSSSAINAWVGEELRSIGAEARVEWRGAAQTISGVAALVRSNDPAGELLAARGWSIGDFISGIGSQVREPDVYAIGNRDPVPLRFNPFMENDGDLGWYAGAAWDAPGRASVAILRYDNEADPSSRSRGESPVLSWRTEFWSLGAKAELGDVVVLGQAIAGSTAIAPSPFFSTYTDFRAAYVLVGWNRDAWRPALRVDAFSTVQLPRTLDSRVREHGTAVTFAINWRPREWLRLTGEALHVYSWRNQRVEEGLAPDRTDDQLQLSARFLF